MNKRFILSFLLLLSFLLSATAQSIDEARAKRIAASFFKSNAARSMRGEKMVQNENLVNNYTARVGDKNCFYIFNRGKNDGFVIVSADERTRQTCWAIRREAAWIIVPVLLTSRLSSIGMRRVSACLSRRMEARAAQPLPTKTQLLHYWGTSLGDKVGLTTFCAQRTTREVIM